MSAISTTYVYLLGIMKDGNLSGPVKVGITSDLDKRTSLLQTGSPHKLVGICSFALPSRNYARSVEAAFHKVCSNKRLIGEWFDYEPLHAFFLFTSNFNSALRNHFCTGFDEDNIEKICDATGLNDAHKFLEALLTKDEWTNLKERGV